MERQNLINQIVDSCVLNVDRKHLRIHLDNISTDNLEYVFEVMNEFEYEEFIDLIDRICPPFIYMDDSKEKPIPIIALGLGEYLSWYRGYRFQVTTTLDGLGCVDFSSPTLRTDIQLAKVLHNKGYRELANLVILSHLMQACLENAKFRKLYNSQDLEDEYSKNCINTFMELTDKSNSIGIKNFNLESIKNSITSSELKSLPIEVFFNNKDDEKTVLYEIGIEDCIFEMCVSEVSPMCITIPKKDQLTSIQYTNLIGRLQYVGMFILDGDISTIVSRYQIRDSRVSYDSLEQLVIDNYDMLEVVLEVPHKCIVHVGSAKIEECKEDLIKLGYSDKDAHSMVQDMVNEVFFGLQKSDNTIKSKLESYFGMELSYDAIDYIKDGWNYVFTIITEDASIKNLRDIEPFKDMIKEKLVELGCIKSMELF